MKIVDCEQGSDQWKALRAGSLGASSIADMVSKTKSGWGASRANLAARLITERLTGVPQDTYTNSAMQWGTETEPQARQMYEFIHDVAVGQVGLVLHPMLDKSHASPDGLIGKDGLLEIKCPNSATHIETLRYGEIDGKYIKQMQWQMAVCERGFCDFVSFDPRLPAELQIWVKRVERDDVMIRELEKEARIFLAEIDEAIADLKSKYQAVQAAA